MQAKSLGIDIGGSGIKGAVVDTNAGQLITERFRLDTPKPARPKAVAKTVAEVVKHFDWQGMIGCTFPAIIRDGVAYSAANVHKSWIETNVEKLIGEATGCQVHALNDADAAGLAEMRHGAGRDHSGVVLLLTIGTGIGSALFVSGDLVPNTELGHLNIRGKKAEDWTSDRARKADDLSWTEFGDRFNTYLQHVAFLFSPDLIIVGGGVSKSAKAERWMPSLELDVPVVPAELRNNAGIVGAAVSASERFGRSTNPVS